MLLTCTKLVSNELMDRNETGMVRRYPISINVHKVYCLISHPYVDQSEFILLGLAMAYSLR